MLHLRCVPTRPGHCRFIVHLMVKDPPLLMWLRIKLTNPRWLNHMLHNGITDGDLAMLAGQVSAALRPAQHPCSQWTIPTPAPIRSKPCGALACRPCQCTLHAADLRKDVA